MTLLSLAGGFTAIIVGAGYTFIKDESTGLRKEMDELKQEVRGGFSKLSTKLDGIGERFNQQNECIANLQGKVEVLTKSK